MIRYSFEEITFTREEFKNYSGMLKGFPEQVNKFYINGIIEFVGIANEYIKINGSIKDYIIRAEYVLSDDYREKLNKYVVELYEKQKDYSKVIEYAEIV